MTNASNAKNLRLTKKAFILLDVRLTFVTFDFVDIAHARQLMQASLLSLKRNFGFAEDTPTQQ